LRREMQRATGDWGSAGKRRGDRSKGGHVQYGIMGACEDPRNIPDQPTARPTGSVQLTRRGTKQEALCTL
jgi:hypothetical protein